MSRVGPFHGKPTRQLIERWEAGRTSPQPAPFAAVVAVIAARLEGVEASDLAHWIRTGEVPAAGTTERAPETPVGFTSGSPKERYREQETAEWLDSLGEGARREFED